MNQIWRASVGLLAKKFEHGEDFRVTHISSQDNVKIITHRQAMKEMLSGIITIGALLLIELVHGA